MTPPPLLFFLCSHAPLRPRANLKRLLAAIQPSPYVEPPPDPWRARVFAAAKHPAFEAGVVGTIVLNTLCMALEHEGQSSGYVVVGGGAACWLRT